MRRFCFRPITLWFILNLLLIINLQTETTNAFEGYVSLSLLCSPEKVNELMSEMQVISVYEKFTNAFDDDDLKDLIRESLTLFKTQMEEAGRSTMKKQPVLVYHKKRICSMVNTLEHTLGYKGNSIENSRK